MERVIDLWRAWLMPALEPMCRRRQSRRHDRQYRSPSRK